MSDATPAAAGGSKKKLIIIIAVAVIAAIGAGVGVTLALTGGKHHGKEVAAKHHKADDEDAAKSDEGDDEEAAKSEDGGDEEATADKEGGKDEKEADAKEGSEGEGKSGPGAEYLALDPAFVVNFQDSQKHTKFLKAEISVVTANPKVQKVITRHMPAVRNSIVLLLSKQVFEDLSTNDGKEKLRADALSAIKDVVTKQANKKAAKGVKDLFFSSLVMQ